MSVSIGVAVLVAATVMPLPTALASDTPPPPPDRTALVLGGTTVPTPDSAYIDAVRNHFIGPTHPGQVTYVPVTAPMEFWPITGAGRLVWLALGPPSVWGLDGPGWPDEPLWKLSGLFDVTFDESVRRGLVDLEDEMAANPSDHLVIFGYSQGAIIANLERRKLDQQYPVGTPGAPDIDFVLLGDPNTPNGGLAARFPGLYIPIVDFTFNGPAPTDTQFDTVVINREYEGVGDFPMYPLNLFSTVNSLLGAVYVHSRDLDVSLPADSPTYQGSHGNTDYYLFPTDDLPLFDPLRTLGVPEPLIDVVEPVFKVVVDLGYDRTIPPWEPTPARLIPPINPVKVTTDLVNAVGEGVNNALALTGSAPLLSIPAPSTTADGNAAVEQVLSAPGTTLKRVSRDVGQRVSQVLSAVGSQLPAPPAVTRDDLKPSQRKVGRQLAATSDQITQTIGAVKSVIGDRRTIVRSAGSDHGSNAATASPTRKTPVRDAVKKASSDIKKVVTKASDSINSAMNGGTHDKNADGDEGEAR